MSLLLHDTGAQALATQTALVRIHSWFGYLKRRRQLSFNEHLTFGSAGVFL